MTLDAAMLGALRSAEIHVPAGELAEQLGISLAQAEAAIERLVQAGFDIESNPQIGCRLLGSPDKLIGDDLLARVGPGCPVAREIMVFAETTSTNDVANRLGREGHAGGAAIFAERQTAGRGRFGRQWDSAQGAGLWFSLLLRPRWPLARWPRLTTWAGVAVAAVIERLMGAAVQLKWPNDVLLDGRKIAGILIESSTDRVGAPFAVAGIGINVNQAAFPPELAERAGSLLQWSGEPYDRSALAAEVLRELGRTLEAAGTGNALFEEAARRSSILGKWVKWQAGGTVVEGVAEALDEEGNLLIRLGDGTLRKASAGEVTSQGV